MNRRGWRWGMSKYKCIQSPANEKTSEMETPVLAKENKGVLATQETLSLSMPHIGVSSEAQAASSWRFALF